MSDNRQRPADPDQDAAPPAPHLIVKFWVSAQYATLLDPRQVAGILLDQPGQEVVPAARRQAGDLAAAVARGDPVPGSGEGEIYDADTPLALIGEAIEDHPELFGLHSGRAVELECGAPADVRVYLAPPGLESAPAAAPVASPDALTREIAALHASIITRARFRDDHPRCRVTKTDLHADAARLAGLVQAHRILAGPSPSSPASVTLACDDALAQFGINLHGLALRINASGRRQPT